MKQLSLSTAFEQGASVWTEDYAPISVFPYHGGKFLMLSYLLSRIPPHANYIEPFAGGATLYWNKRMARSNTLNDKLANVVNFYMVLQKRMSAFLDMVDGWAYSEHFFTPVQKQEPLAMQDMPCVKSAAEFWFAITCSKLSTGDTLNLDKNDGRRKRKHSSKMHAYFSRKRILHSCMDALIDKLQNTQITNRCALRIIRTLDTTDAFFYIDPPYMQTEHKFYPDFTEQDFCDMLELLAGMQGKFMLSTFAHPALRKYPDWRRESFSMRNNFAPGAKKEELLLMNY